MIVYDNIKDNHTHIITLLEVIPMYSNEGPIEEEFFVRRNHSQSVAFHRYNPQTHTVEEEPTPPGNIPEGSVVLQSIPDMIRMNPRNMMDFDPYAIPPNTLVHVVANNGRLVHAITTRLSGEVVEV